MLFCLVSVSLVLLIPILWGVSAPPQFLPNPVQPVFRLPTAPVSGETPHRPVASDQRIQQLQEELASTRQAISALCDSGIRPPQSLFDSTSSLSRDLEDARQSSSRPGVSPSVKPSSVQSGPSRPEFDPAVAGPSRRRSFDSPQHSLGHSSRQGSDTPPARDVGSLAIRLMMRTHHLKLANNGTISRTKRTIFVLPHWTFY